MSIPESVEKRFSVAPVNNSFGFTLESLGEGTATISMPSDSKWMQEEGVIHGGVLMAIGDCASGQAIIHDLPDDIRCASSDMSIQLFRPAWPNAEPLRATGKILKLGKRLVFSCAEVYQGDVQVAYCTFTNVLFKRK